MSNIIPEKGLQYKVYLNGTDMLGIAEGTFPTIELGSTEITGAGIAGSVEAPGVGQINSMTVTLTWRNIQKDVTRLLVPGSHILEMHADHQDFNAGLGIIKHKHIYVFMRARTKSVNLGNLVINDVTGTETEHEVDYLKIEIDGSEVCEIDKYNYICRIHGVDYLAEVRRNLGM